jgi:hypothetical protein
MAFIKPNAAPLRECKKCGSTRFFVHESYLWTATLYEDGSLAAFNPDCGIDVVACQTCATEYVESDFASIDFN